MAKLSALLLPLILFIVAFVAHTTFATVQPKAPNFQYFERPKYRYPYYDEHGRENFSTATADRNCTNTRPTRPWRAFTSPKYRLDAM
uniref:IP17765p n=1 Tax=Drosophila melanogaster TaxID=7227 RepID=A2VEJ8_DROME|nr:IP17765p [Drosophila melanogaster]